MSKVDEARLLRLQALAAETSEPDTSDLPEASSNEWKVAAVGRFFQSRKEAVTLHLDADVLDWFRRSAPGSRGYQAAINAALRQHVSRNKRQ